MSMDVTPDSSAILADLTTTPVAENGAAPPAPATAVCTLAQPAKLQNFFAAGAQKRPPPPPPSTRSDLPSNVIVTSVDVEAEDFVPGVSIPNFVAPPQAPYAAQAQSTSKTKTKTATAAAEPAAASPSQPTISKAALDASEYFNAYSGYYGSLGSSNKSNNKKKQKGNDKTAEGETVPANLEKYVAKLDENGWPGWPSAEDLEGGLFDTYSKVTAPGDGEKVAIKVRDDSSEHAGQFSDHPTRSSFDPSRFWSCLHLPSCLLYRSTAVSYSLWNHHRTALLYD